MKETPQLDLRQMARGFWCAQTQDRRLAWFDRSPANVIARAHTHLGVRSLVPRRPTPPGAA